MGSKKRECSPRNPELVLEFALTAKFKMPSMYRVYLLNDDFTPMVFVVEVLERYFSMEPKIAMEIMLQVHQYGKAMCGLYPRDIAETKVVQVNEYSRRNEHPLLCRVEES